MPSRKNTTPLGPIRKFTITEEKATFRSRQGTLDVVFLKDDVVRLRAVKKGQNEPDRSFAVIPTGWDKPETRITVRGDSVILATSNLSVRISLKTGRIRILSADRTDLFRNAEIAWSGAGVGLIWKMPKDRHIYGTGERTGPLDKRGTRMAYWNTDRSGYPVEQDPLYQSIPFALCMDGPRAHGFFFDNTFRQDWEFSPLGKTKAKMTADDGALDLYVMASGTPSAVLERWTELTGRMSLPPLWALGYQQCKWSYYPESVVRDIADQFRQRSIPCDVIYLDIDYMDAYKDFTWHPERFPDPPKLVSDLRDQGFRTVVMLDPGVKVEEGYDVYETLKQAGFVVRNADGTPFIGPVWPGDCLFPDFTDAACREWWGKWYKGLLDLGVAGFWNDMNEPAVFDAPGHSLPLDAVFSGDGYPGDHRRFHNIYGMQMVRGTTEGLRALRPDQRHFVLTRAAYAGTQRYAAAWTGDNCSDWPSLRISIPMLLNFGLSGQAFCGPDIGGFAGTATPELFARWLQVGALYPFCRTHYAAAPQSGHPDINAVPTQEPWSYGDEWEEINRASLELRYKLLPYLYTVFEEITRTGMPVMRPLFLQYPDDPKTACIEDEFLIGSDLLCAPILDEGRYSRELYLPKGLWYDYWSGECLEGGRKITASAPIDVLPLFARAGSAIPTQDVVQHTREAVNKPIVWQVWPDSGFKAIGTLYEDDGETLAYTRGDFKRTTLTLSGTKENPETSLQHEGGYTGRPQEIVIAA
ncbi:MAG TPA: glycoside hydrolase family 31 protein [Armatimonadota bacterium]|nr:glycoside hydrolase family 31 protein [Armatimonadota bacterium]